MPVTQYQFKCGCKGPECLIIDMGVRPSSGTRATGAFCPVCYNRKYGPGSKHNIPTGIKKITAACDDCGAKLTMARRPAGNYLCRNCREMRYLRGQRERSEINRVRYKEERAQDKQARHGNPTGSAKGKIQAKCLGCGKIHLVSANKQYSQKMPHIHCRACKHLLNYDAGSNFNYMG